MERAKGPHAGGGVSTNRYLPRAGNMVWQETNTRDRQTNHGNCASAIDIASIPARFRFETSNRSAMGERGGLLCVWENLSLWYRGAKVGSASALGASTGKSFADRLDGVWARCERRSTVAGCPAERLRAPMQMCSGGEHLRQGCRSVVDNQSSRGEADAFVRSGIGSCRVNF